MAAQSPPPITPVPTPPIQRGDRATFSQRVDAFVLWLVGAVTQFAALAANVYANAVDAFTSATTAALAATTATAQANAAQAVAGVAQFNPAENYGAGTPVFSLLNGQTYRRVTAGTSATDPANDQTNWRLLSGNDINGTFIPIPVAALNLDLSLGSYFTKTISGNSTFTFSNVPPAGSSFTLELINTASVIVAFPAAVKSPSNVAPALQANKMHKLMFVSSNGGARFTLSAVTNYDI